jgi:hypothetical protein
MSRTILYTIVRSISTETFPQPTNLLRQAVENRGDTVVGSFVDYGPEIRLRQRNVGWKNILASLDGVDQVAVMSAGDLPGKTAKDLLRLLGHLREHNVSLFVHNAGIDTSNGSAAFMDLIQAYRAAKLSQAIRKGIVNAREVGKVIGRPKVPASVRYRIQACLAQGCGIRPTAKRYRVSPGTVINIRRSMVESLDAEAA